MASDDDGKDLQKKYEAELSAVVDRRIGQGRASDWALVRALIHRAVHLAADRKAGEFCAVALLMAEMTTHAHDLMHGKDEPAPHRDGLH